WMARIEKMLPAGYTVRAGMWGDASLCDVEMNCHNIAKSFDGADLGKLFDDVAAGLRTPKKGTDWLRAMSFPTWTVQLASSPLYEGAHAMADEVVSESGHMRVGHTGVSVFEAERGDGYVYKVYAGVFTSKS